MDDEALVSQALAGETQAIAALYDRYADRLYDYARRLTGNPADAHDAVHDSFLVAMQRLGQLRDHSRFRPWMYAIVRTEVARKRLRTDRLHFGVWDDPVSTDVVPSRAAEITELQQLIADAADGLSDDDREVLDLHLRHGLTGPEMAAALAIPERHVSVTMQRVRDRLARGLGVVLVGRSPTCAEFATLREREGDELTELARKRLARHIDGCATCTTDRDARMRPETLLAALPMALAPAAMRAVTLKGAGAAAASGSMAGAAARVAGEAGRTWLRDGFPTLVAARRVARLWLAAAVGGTTLLAGGAAMYVRTERAPARVATTESGVGRTLPGDSLLSSTSTPTTAVVTTVPTADTTDIGGTATTVDTSVATTVVATTPPPDSTVPATTPPPPPPAPDTAAPEVTDPNVADYRISSQDSGVGTCYIETTTTFSVTVTDDVAATSVKIAWVAPGGATRTTTLTAGGTTWSGTIGPFPFSEIPPGDVVKYDVTVTARDAAGNTTVLTLSRFGVVDSCPPT
jgi:RNA polymerase sigma factor (sigma-70 family)